MNTFKLYNNLISFNSSFECRNHKIELEEYLIKYFIGSNGYHFNKIIKDSGIYFIEFDKIKNFITLKGNASKLDIAEDKLFNHLSNINKTLKNKKEINLNLKKELIGLFIGTKGSNLNEIKENSGAICVWYDSAKNKIVIYGNEQNIIKAENLINEKIIILNNSKDLSNNKVINLEMPECLIGYFIGSNRFYLNKIKEDSKINLIWFNKNENNIVIYGKDENLNIAEKMIKTRISEIYNNSSMIINEKLKLSIKNDLLPVLIGKNGFFFKKIKEETNVHYLWYNKDLDLIEISGVVSNVLNAKEKLKDKMNYINFMYGENNSEFHNNECEIIESKNEPEFNEEKLNLEDSFNDDSISSESESQNSLQFYNGKEQNNSDKYNNELSSIIETLSKNSNLLSKNKKITITINNIEDDNNEKLKKSNYNPPSMITFLPKGGFILPDNHVIYIKLNDIPDIIISMLIGRKGFYFNEITKESNTNYIWYDKEKKHIEIWGPPENLNNAKIQIENRLNILLLRFNSKVKLHK